MRAPSSRPRSRCIPHSASTPRSPRTYANGADTRESSPWDSVIIGAGRELHQPVLVRERQRLEQDGIDDAENGRIGADAQGQGENRHRRESLAAVQLAQCVPNILLESVHSRSSDAIIGWITESACPRPSARPYQHMAFQRVSALPQRRSASVDVR